MEPLLNVLQSSVVSARDTGSDGIQESWGGTGDCAEGRGGQLDQITTCPYPLFVSSANRPRGRISAVSQVPALALWEGRALVNGGVGGEERRGRGFVGCDCLIPGGLSFHSSSHLIPHQAGVVRAAASPSSGTRLASPSPRASRTANARPAGRHTEGRQCLKSRPSSKMSLACLLQSH
ncbi:unnamed protein product [Pleuronectes platessa]|uniref:Uncharacterized protein n=1 Tax=Pleuronectes platessa TaxID=8262 RepID=A0A9N7Z733_PLEPL|nr:unnamed protein product [Pleuronectes platessa]